MIRADCISIVRLMAGITVDWCVYVVAGVTRITLSCDGQMSARERELRDNVIKTGWGPTRICSMALSTISREIIRNVIGIGGIGISCLMARITSRARAGEAALMALSALSCDREMRTGQREQRRVMIKRGWFPARICSMALCAR